MRTKLFPILVLILLVVLAGGAFACKAPVVVPVPTGVVVKGDILVWDEVPNAIEYHVTVDDENVIIVYEPQYTIELYDSIPHTLTVSAVTADGESAKSVAVSYTRASENKAALKVLAAPSMRISATRLMWNNVLGNSGYRIFFNDQTIELGKNTTYYDLTFPSDGEYIIRMQTIGDGVTYYSSQKSEMKATITSGKAKLLKLSSESIRFDPVKKQILWDNKYSATSVRYQIYKDDVMVTEIDADSSLPVMAYSPVFVGTTTYTMRLASNDGLYDYSAFSEGITFPIAEPAVTGLSLVEDSGYYYFVWDKCKYATNYRLTIDGNTYSASAERIALPSGLPVGEHSAKVNAVGDGQYLAGSVASAEFPFTLGVGGVPVERLDTPVIRLATLNDEHCVISLVPVTNATGYAVSVLKGEEKVEFTVTDTDITLLRTSEDPTVLKVFELLDAGGRLSVSAYSDKARFLVSPYSAEIILASDVEAVDAPAALTIFPGGVKWDELKDTEEYLLSVDGEIIRTSWTRYEPIFTSGEHVFKVAANKDNALFSEELYVTLPLRLDTPSGLQVTSGMLSFLSVQNAASYELFADGVSVGQVSVSLSAIDLSNYIETDGRYVLTLRANAPSRYYADSYLSEEIVYVKTDGKSGTMMKPYRIGTAEEFVTMLRSDPTAYYVLTEAEYDFKDVDTSALSRLTFTGHIIGNNAVLKNIVSSTGLFDTIEGSNIEEAGHVPEIADVTFEIRLYGFTFEGRGLFAKKIKTAALKNVTVKLSGATTLTKESAFGLVAYEVSDSIFDGFAFVSDGLTVSSSQRTTVAALAYKLGGEVRSFSTGGTLTLTVKDLTYGGVSREGECTLTDPSLALAINVTSTTAALYGVTIAGRTAVSGGTLTGVTTVRNANDLYYYGVAKENVSVSSVSVGGSLTVTDSRRAEIYGILGGASGTVMDTTCSLTLDCVTTEVVIAAGIAEEIETGLTLSGVSFAGSFTLASPSVQSAALAIRSDIPVTASYAGSITASGANALLSGGVIEGAGADVTFTEGASLSLSNVTNGVIVGAAQDSTATVAARGSLSLSASDCEEISVSGVFGGTDGTVDVDGLTVTGDFHAGKVSFGGVADATQTLGGRIVSLTVDLTVISDDMRIGGAIAYAESLALTEKAVVTANIVANGTGQVAGFAAEMMNATVENLLVDGSISFTGEGEIAGAVGRAYGITNVESRVGLTARGNVRVSGIADEIGEGSRLTLSKATITLVSDQARVYGVAANASTLSAKLSEVTFTVSPLTDGGGSAELCGMSDALSSASGIQIEKTTFTIGRFYAASFASVAKTAGGSLRSGTFGYTLVCTAVNSEIGGAFGNVDGLIDGFTFGTVSAPVTMTVGGNAVIGGIAATAGKLTVNKLSTDIRLSLNLPENGTAKVGGAICMTSNTVTMTDTIIGFTLSERNGAGTAYVGGAVAELSGELFGARTQVAFSSTVPSDVFGGIAAKMRGGCLTLCSAKGSISAANAGGLVGNSALGEGSVRSTVKKCATCLAMTGGAGLIYVAEKTDIEDSYSISRTGAGLIYSATDLKLTNTYFGGIADYSVAYRAVGTSVVGLIVEASLHSVPVQNTGDALAPVYKTLAYAADVKSLADTLDRETWTLTETAYPYLTELGSVGTQSDILAKTLTVTEITDGFDLYAEASYRSFDSEVPAVVWVDQSGKMVVKDGIVTLTDNGEGELRGYLSGGKLVYILPYVINVFEPFTGTGSDVDPYVITDLVNFKHVPRFANDYYAANGTLAHFRFEVGTYEDVVFPTLTASYAAEIDCNGVILRSPMVSAGGIFGNMTGGSVTDLTIENAAFEDYLLFDSVTDVTLTSVNVRLMLEGGDCTVAGSMTDSFLTSSSFTVDEEGEDFALYIVDEAHGTSFSLVQLFLSAPNALPTATCSFVREDDSSVFERSAVYIAAELNEAYPFAETGLHTTVNASAAAIYCMIGEKSACSTKTEVTLSDLTLRFCDCDLFRDGEIENATSHSEDANVFERVAIASDALTSSFATFIANYTLTNDPAKWKITTPSEEYNSYYSFYEMLYTFFMNSRTEIASAPVYPIKSGAIIGLTKPFAIGFGDDTTDDLRSLAARLFGYEETDALAEKAAGIAALLTENEAGASADSIQDRLVYDGAIRTANNYYVLPYAFVSGSTVTLACVFVAPDGTTSLWLSDLVAAKKVANLDGGSLMQQRVITEAYGRCSLFENVTVAPVKRATGVSYTNVLIAVDSDFDPIMGVTFVDYKDMRPILASAPYSFTDGAFPTPIGYETFGRGDEDLTFTLTDGDDVVTSLTLDGVSEWDIYENWYIESDAPFGEAVTFSLSGLGGTVTKEGVLRVRSNGTGTLTVTNFYGETASVALTVVNYHGFDYGSGTEEDPYQIWDVDDLETMSHFENAHFILKANIFDTIYDPLSLHGGTLHGEGKTLHLNISNVDHLFDVCTGTIEDVDFEIDAIQSAGGLIADEATALTLKNVSFSSIDAVLNVAEGETVGLFFNVIEGGTWDGVYVNGSAVVNVPQGGTVGFLAGRMDQSDLTNVYLDETITLSASGAVAFGGLAGVSASYEDSDLVHHLIGDITVTATLASETDSLILGGVVGSASAAMSDLDLTLDITVNATDKQRGTVFVGGAVGDGSAALSDVTATGTVTVYAGSGCVGGVVGNGMGELTNMNVNVTVYAECAVRAIAGGVAGRLDSALYRGSARGSVTAIGHLTDKDISALENTDDVIVALTAAGGAVGYMEGTLSRFTVTSVTVSATAAGVTHGYVLAGGAAGYVASAKDIAVNGATVTAVGTESVAGGIAAVLKYSLNDAVVSDVTLSAASKGGAVGVFSLMREAAISAVFCTVDVGSTGAAIADHIIIASPTEPTGTVSYCLYLYGKVIGDDVASAYDVENVKASAVTEFYGTTPYDTENVYFDTDVWAFHVDGLPTLK